MTNTMEKIATGIPGFEVLTKGGIPRGRTTLVSGRSGTGKSIFALQVACSLAAEGEPAIYVAIEERPGDLEATANSLGFDASTLVKARELQFLDLRRPAQGPTHVTGEYDISGLCEILIARASSIGAKLIVIDSITALFRPRPDENTIRTLVFQLVNTIEDRGLTLIITAEAPHDYSRATTFGVEDYVCDLVLVLRNVIDGKRRRRSIEVQKYRRSAHYKGEYPFTITEHGLTIFPMDASRDAEVSKGERFSSGLAGLDAMNSGGWLRDSIVIVRGPTGSGKTTLAGMYARAGAERGERVAYYGFEETRSMLLRNFDQIGMDMRPHAKNLEIVCRYPEAMSPEDLLIELRRDLDKHAPSLIVLDSISSLEHSTSTEGFRVFMVGLAAMLREHGRSALLTQTIAAHAEATHDPPFLSTIADAILVLDYTSDQPTLERTIRVLKMRGSAHDMRKRRLQISAGGLSVAPVDEPRPAPAPAPAQPAPANSTRPAQPAARPAPARPAPARPAPARPPEPPAASPDAGEPTEAAPAADLDAHESKEASPAASSDAPEVTGASAASAAASPAAPERTEAPHVLDEHAATDALDRLELAEDSRETEV